MVISTCSRCMLRRSPAECKVIPGSVLPTCFFRDSLTEVGRDMGDEGPSSMAAAAGTITCPRKKNVPMRRKCRLVLTETTERYLEWPGRGREGCWGSGIIKDIKWASPPPPPFSQPSQRCGRASWKLRIPCCGTGTIYYGFGFSESSESVLTRTNAVLK